MHGFSTLMHGFFTLMALHMLWKRTCKWTTKHAGQDVPNGRSTNLSPFTKGCREQVYAKQFKKADFLTVTQSICDGSAFSSRGRRPRAFSCRKHCEGFASPTFPRIAQTCAKCIRGGWAHRTWPALRRTVQLVPKVILRLLGLYRICSIWIQFNFVGLEVFCLYFLSNDSNCKVYLTCAVTCVFLYLRHLIHSWCVHGFGCGCCQRSSDEVSYAEFREHLHWRSLAS